MSLDVIVFLFLSETFLPFMVFANPWILESNQNPDYKCAIKNELVSIIYKIIINMSYILHRKQSMYKEIVKKFIYYYCFFYFSVFLIPETRAVMRIFNAK